MVEFPRPGLPAAAPPPPPRQQPAQDEQDEVVRVNSNLVQVDAVVVDGRGRQVTDLQPSDFEVVEDGAPRRPEYAQYVAVDGGASGGLSTSSLFLSSASGVASAAPPPLPGGESLSAYMRGVLPAGGTLRYQFYVYNAARDETRGASNLQVQVTLRQGGVAQAITPARNVTQLDNPVFVGGDILLEGMPPGRYTLEASVTDQRSRTTRTVVSHPFQITN